MQAPGDLQLSRPAALGLQFQVGCKGSHGLSDQIQALLGLQSPNTKKVFSAQEQINEQNNPYKIQYLI